MYNKVIIERYQNQAKFDMARRQIVLDTETTGIDPKQGHRIIEIGCVELMNLKLFVCVPYRIKPDSGIFL